MKKLTEKLTPRQFKRAREDYFGKSRVSKSALMRRYECSLSEIKRILWSNDYSKYLEPTVNHRVPKLLPHHLPDNWAEISGLAFDEPKLPFEPSTIEDVMRELKIMHQDLLNKLDQLSAQK